MPLFAFYRYVLVVLWWGCKGFRGVRLRVFDIGARFRWYVEWSWGLSGFGKK